MAKFKERELALQLRMGKGMSYSQIKERLRVSKSSLSIWLRDYPLSRERINELRAWSEKRIERFRDTMRRKKEARLNEAYFVQKKQLLPLTNNELFIAGLFLYAGEGSKTSFGEVSLSNTNPAIVKFFLYWLTKILYIPKDKIKIKLHLYRDMDKDKEERYWMGAIGLRKKHFKNPYIKASSSKRISYRGGFGHGTCNVIVRDTRLFEKIIMGIKVIMDDVSGA